MQVDKGGVVVYKMHITQQHINDGFAIGAWSAQGSRFKLLLFQQYSDGSWEQLAQASVNLTSQGRFDNTPRNCHYSALHYISGYVLVCMLLH